MVTRLGLIGYGKWGHNIERTLLSFSEVSVVAIGRAETVPSNLHGVLIATSSSTHAAIALRHIEAGIPTFIEKPMATSVGDAKRICEAVDRTRTPVFVGHIHLYNPVFAALLDALPELGPVRYVICESANHAPRADSSVLWDWLPHDLSMAAKIFRSDPTSAQAWSLTGGSAPQAATSRFQYGSASLVSMMSWLAPIRRQRMTVCAERAVLVFDDKAERKLLLQREGDTISYPEYADELPLTCELRAFLAMIRSGAMDRSHVTLGACIVRAIAAAEESIAQGGATVAVGGAARSYSPWGSH